MQSENLSYQKEVQDRIRRSLSTRSRSFPDIVRGCQGAYPTVVRDALDKLRFDIVSRPASVFELSANLRQQSNQSRLASVEGNPVLSSWYFTDETCSRFAHLQDWSQRRIAFLGTPRLFEWFARASLGNQRLLLDLDLCWLVKVSVRRLETRRRTDTLTSQHTSFPLLYVVDYLRYAELSRLPPRAQGTLDS